MASCVTLIILESPRTLHNFPDISCLNDPKIEADPYFEIHIVVSLQAEEKIRDNAYFLIADISLCISHSKKAVYCMI